MPFPTFQPEVDPSPGAMDTPQISLNETGFGDGFVQSSPKGLNHIKRSFSLKWETLTQEQASAIDTFLTGQGGYKPFYYTVPSEGVLRKWTCKQWTTNRGIPSSVNATFVESFILDT